MPGAKEVGSRVSEPVLLGFALLLYFYFFLDHVYAQQVFAGAKMDSCSSLFCFNSIVIILYRNMLNIKIIVT